MQKNIYLLIIAGIIIFIFGAGVGVSYQLQGGFSAKKETAFKTLSSKVVQSVVSYGEITKISDRNLNLSFAGDTITVYIKESAPIVSFVGQAAGANQQAQKNIEFKDIKVGDYANIVLKVMPDAGLEAQTVMIVPPYGGLQ